MCARARCFKNRASAAGNLAAGARGSALVHLMLCKIWMIANAKDKDAARKFETVASAPARSRDVRDINPAALVKA